MTKPRVLIVGAAGMLGHKVWQVFRTRFDTWVTLRGDAAEYRKFDLFDVERTIGRVRAEDFDTVVAAFAAGRPDVVVNCVGIVKQLRAAKDPIVSLTVNALFPHRLAALCRATGARFVHISTDCVFSGRRGMYAETDIADAEDLYGRTKLLGEVTGPGALTLRTSIVGRELNSTSGLLEWFLSRRGGQVSGYTNAVFSGVTTSALGGILADVIEKQPALSGLYHVASERIDKHDLLLRLNVALGAGITVVPSADVTIDRSLDGRRFRDATGFAVPDWTTMIAELAADPTRYDEWRNLRVS